MRNELAISDIDIDAAPEAVWHVLTDNALMGEVMFGSEVVTDWRVGSAILYRGEWQGTPYEDRGEILEADAPRLLRVTHFSPMSGEPDVPENYHEVRYELESSDAGTHVTLTQDNNATEAAAAHSKKNWDAMLASLKAVAER